MTTVFLVASEHGTRGEVILSALRRGGEPAVPYGDTAGIRHPAPSDAARAEVVAALDAVDPDWPAFVAMLYYKRSSSFARGSAVDVKGAGE